MIDKSFIEAVQQGTATAVLKIGEKEYSTRQLHNAPLPTEPEVETLDVSSLSGIATYCNAIEELNGHAGEDLLLEDLLLHVVSHACVSLRSKIKGEHRRRDEFVRATLDDFNPFEFDHFFPHSIFVIKLQSLFMDYGDRAKVLKAVGTIRDEAIKTSSDDGVTQRVTASAGVVLNAEIALPNPVMLRPFRTFREVEQPPSQFVLRVQAAKSGQLPDCALFEADGGAWKREARASIKEYLAAETSGIRIIG